VELHIRTIERVGQDIIEDMVTPYDYSNPCFSIIGTEGWCGGGKIFCHVLGLELGPLWKDS